MREAGTSKRRVTRAPTLSARDRTERKQAVNGRARRAHAGRAPVTEAVRECERARSGGRRCLRSCEQTRALRDDHGSAGRLPSHRVRKRGDDFDRRRGGDDRFVVGTSEGGAVLVRVFTRAVRHRRGLVIVLGVVIACVIVRVHELPVLAANFVGNHGKMQGGAELCGGDGPRQQRPEQAQQQPGCGLRKP